MEKCAEQQRLLFLGMCSLEDRKRICDEKKWIYIILSELLICWKRLDLKNINLYLK